MALDTFTVVVVAVVVTGLMAGAHLVVWFRHRDEPSILWIVAATMAGSASAILRWTPETLAIFAANAAILLALTCIGTACRVLGGRPPALGWLLGVPTAWLAACCLPAVLGDQDLRIVIASGLCALCAAWAVDELWRDRREALVARRWLATILGLHGLAAFLRMVVFEWHRGVPRPGLAAGGEIAAVMLWSLALILLAGFATVAAVRERCERGLRRIAGEDGLTGLCNRRHLDLALPDLLARAEALRQPLAVVLVDADAFKAFNDRYGHVAGDACLRVVAGVLAETFAGREAVVARFGGEEFAVVLPAVTAHRAARLAERARRAIRARAIPHDGSPHGRVTVSAGVSATLPGGRIAARAMLEAADLALYAAKRAGRDRVALAPDASDGTRELRRAA